MKQNKRNINTRLFIVLSDIRTPALIAYSDKLCKA